MKSKTLCFFNSTQSWGGGEKWHFEVALALQNKGYTIVFFTNPGSELFKKISKTKIKVIPVKISNLSFLNPFKIFLLKKKLKENDVDTIIMNLSADLKVAGFASKLAKIRRIIYRRGSDIPIKNSILNRYIFSKILTGIIANTEATKKSILVNNSKLFDANRIKVIYNGINLSKFDKSFEQKEKIEKQEEIIIGNIGRLVPQKAQTQLIELAKILKKKQISFKILIGGTGFLEVELKEMVKVYKLEKFVTFVGFVENPKQFLEGIDIFVLTSKWEGFGYVIVEAGACRKPIVAYNISSNPEVIEDKKTGYLVEYGDINSLSEKIILLFKDKKLRDKIGKAGRKQVEEKFTLERTIEAVERYLK